MAVEPPPGRRADPGTLSDPAPSGQRVSPWVAPLRFVARTLLSVILILWTLVELLLFPLLRPLVAAVSRLPHFTMLGSALGRLPPYAALVAFAVPFIVIEPVKGFALYWLGIGHFIQGGVLYIASHVASIVIVDRIYHSAREPLMRIDWFRRLMVWLVGLRRIGTDWAKSTAAWRGAAALARLVKSQFANWISALR
jgi:hypothetical protein